MKSYPSPIEKKGKKVCIIDPADVVQEATFWNGSIIYAVLGAKPPLKVFEGFVRRVWASFGIDKVLWLDSNHYVVRFNGEVARDAIVEHGI